MLSHAATRPHRPRPSAPKQIHKIQNLNHALAFLREKGVKLVGIGAEAICDGNQTLIMGLLWTIILWFDIADLSVEKSSGKDALLLWAQRKTVSCDNVNVTNFHKSWKDGLAFCALIHQHRPHLIDYASLSKANPRENLVLAMKVAEESLDLLPMIDPDDMLSGMKPDERSVMTQVAQFYKLFSSDHARSVNPPRKNPHFERKKAEQRPEANAGGSSDSVQVRGDCMKCGNPVTTGQKRTRGNGGKYCHTPCFQKLSSDEEV